ncbi:hypothetical protein [Streptomyces virginiae]|uniref:hypothetical protein n=1 Tax=Streptomyces virginiae TaxID=1961 RepID=UPI00342388E5
MTPRGLDDLTGDLDTALAWAATGDCALQQTLPHPFHDVLLYGDNDNRPPSGLPSPTPLC